MIYGICSERCRGWYEGVFVFGIMTAVVLPPLFKNCPRFRTYITYTHNKLPISVNHELMSHWNRIKIGKLVGSNYQNITCHDTYERILCI